MRAIDRATARPTIFFLATLGAATLSWSRPSVAEQATPPVVGFLRSSGLALGPEVPQSIMVRADEIIE